MSSKNEVSGSGNIQIVGVGGNVVIGETKQPRPIVKAEPPQGSITMAERAEIKAKIDEWVTIHNNIKRKELTHKSAWSSLNRHMDVPGYTYILSANLNKAKAYIQRQIAILNSAKSAPKKADDWRKGRMAAIHARCKQYGLEAWRLTYMKNKFGVDSMVMLGDDDLEKLYRSVMSKKTS